MKLSELRRIAARRTPGEWSSLSPSPYMKYPGENPSGYPQFRGEDLALIAALVNASEQLFACVEAGLKAGKYGCSQFCASWKDDDCDCGYVELSDKLAPFRGERNDS